MLDPKFIRDHADEVKRNCARRDVAVNVDAFLRLDGERRSLIQDAESLRADRNAVAEAMKSVEASERETLIGKGKALKEGIAAKEAALSEIEGPWTDLLRRIPNMTHPDVPDGETDGQNIEVRTVGEVRRLMDPKDHVQIAETHDLIDFARGAKVAGAKFYFLKGKLALLEQALIRFALDRLSREGFIPMATPDVAKDEILIGTGFQPRGPETQIYSLEGTDLSLIGTSEITVGGYHAGEILPEDKLPLKYAAFSHCFRTEAGTYGRESYGLYRVHQFSKVEMFVFCTPEQSEAIHAELLRHEEGLFEAMGIPYRVVDTCTGDLGGPAYRKFDLEAWMWGRGEGTGGWGEVTSASNCTDYQARRLNIRTKTPDGETRFVHTLNGTAIATSRALIAILENGQNDDGSVTVPDVLVPYCGFDRIG
ncbi:serine--tRNA ligase [Candidatus Uhrbacteria bacterium]|nr:serine--tRNA ligase [Candidatus Uhrbacteria bacterium]